MALYNKGNREVINRIGDMADKYDVPLINGCLYNEEIWMDYTKDGYGDGASELWRGYQIHKMAWSVL